MHSLICFPVEDVIWKLICTILRDLCCYVLFMCESVYRSLNYEGKKTHSFFLNQNMCLEYCVTNWLSFCDHYNIL